MFNILTVSEAISFESEQSFWVLVEKNNPFLSIRRDTDNISKTRKLSIPDSVFENNTFLIGNNCEVCKCFIIAKKDNSNNLEIKFDNECNTYIDFNTIESLIEILKDKKQLLRIKQVDEAERAAEVFSILHVEEEEKTKYKNQINEDLKVFFAFQRCGELQEFESWAEGRDIEYDLKYIEAKLREVIDKRI